MVTRWRSVWLILALGMLLFAGGCDSDDGGEGEGEGEGETQGCADDSECEDGYYCYTAAGAVRGLCSAGCRTEPDNCLEGQICDSDSHICVDEEQPCEADADCPDRSTYCDVASGDCLDGCREDGDCGDLQECVEHVCTDREPGCTTSDDCEEGQWCNTDLPLAQCEEGCATASDCPGEKPYCIDHECRPCADCPEPCDDEAGDQSLRCPEGWFCDALTASCEELCKRDDDCGFGEVCCTEEICERPVCVTACDGLGPDACPEGWVCNAQTGHCEEGCADDGVCPPGQICDGVCRDGCRMHEECELGQVCDPDDFVCRAGCRDDAGCLPEEECVNLECAPRSCAGHGDCPEEFYCDAGLGRCVEGCRDDAACVEAGEICNAQHECVAGCDGDEDCGFDSVCDLDTARCVPGCREDALEPNDSSDAATGPELVDGAFEDDALRLCAGNEDWFAVDLAASEGLRAQILFPRLDGGGLGLELQDGDGQQLGLSEATDTISQQLVVEPVDAETTVLVRVFGMGLAEASGLTYTLSITVAGDGACIDDGEEPNSSANTASPLVDGEQPGLVLCPEDEDWYAVDLADGDGIAVTVAIEADRLPPTVELLHALDGGDPQVLATATRPEGDPPRLELELDPVPDDGAYLLRVRGENAAALAYGLTTSLERRQVVCVADELEDNDTQEAALPLEEPLYEALWEELTVCAGDDDWYSIQTLQGDELFVEVALAEGAGNLDLQLYRGVELLATAATDGAEERILMPDLEPGVYQLRIFGRNGASGGYSLRVEKSLAQCIDDVLEEDDSLDAATLMACGETHDALVSCWGDDDYFELELDSWASLEAHLLFEPLGGALDFELLASDGDLVNDEPEAMDGGLRLNEEFLSPGSYYLMVYSLSDGANRYALELSCEEVEAPCAADLAEPNEVFLDGWPVALNHASGGTVVVEPLRVCGADDHDWFAFSVQQGEELDILATFFHFEGDLSLELYCGDDFEEPVATADTGNDDEHLVYVVPSDTICGLRVSGVPQDAVGTDYSLTFTIDP